ncbi:MAG: hypothetical protein NTW52_06465 [Planctomycetota bacterium]|nr:hypothetical protein [Planctomycetota bacterium]
MFETIIRFFVSLFSGIRTTVSKVFRWNTSTSYENADEWQLDSNQLSSDYVDEMPQGLWSRIVSTPLRLFCRDDSYHEESDETPEAMWKRILLAPIRFFVSEDEDHLDGPSQALWKRILIAPLQFLYLVLVTIPVAILLFPFHGFWELAEDRRRQALWGLPALFAGIAICAVLLSSINSQHWFETRYQTRMMEAMANKDFKLASLLGGRVIAESAQPSPALLLNQAIALASAGEVSRSQTILSDLAPNDRPGYGPAHKICVQLIENSIGPNPDLEILDKLKWHLECAGDSKSSQLGKSWARYYMLIGQPDRAAEYLALSTDADPKMLLPLAEIYEKAGNQAAVERTLRKAVDSLAERLAVTPTDNQVRLLLALALVKQKRIAEAELEVINAMKLNPDQATVRSAANFYIMLYDRVKPTASNVKDRLDILRKGLNIDKNYVDIYDRLIVFVSQNTGTEESEEVKLMLKKSIVEGQALDMAHFALSSILIAEGKLEDARLHLEQSFSLNPNMPAVCNNLAWIMANREPPNLKDAEQLAERALAAMPNNPTFHDTLGTIWMKQGRYREAATQLEKAMQQNLPNTGVHLKLADIYQKLGDDPLASLHREKAESLVKKTRQ